MPPNIGHKSQYQRGLLLLRDMGYKEEQIVQVQGLVDAVMEDYDSCLRLFIRRIALTSAALSKTSLSAATGGKARRLIDDNDEAIDSGLEFLARRTFDRIPIELMTSEKNNLRQLHNRL